MRIVQALGWYFPESLGGTEVYVAALSRRLQEAGHEVLVAAPDPRDAQEREYDHAATRVYRYPIPSRPTRDEAQGRVPVRGAERFAAWLRRLSPDVVHVHSLVTGLGVPELEAARAAGSRVYLTVHTSGLGYLCQRGTLMRWGTRPCDGLAGPAKCAACELQHRGAPRSLAWALGALPPGLARTLSSVPGKLGTALGMSDLIGWNQQRQRALVAAVDRLVLLTRWALDAVAANGAPAAKLALNRLGSDLVGARPKPGPEQRPSVRPLTVGYLGRLDPIKGIADLVRAAAALPREVDIRVEIRGPRAGQAERRHLSELVGLAGGDPRIRFEDAVPFADVPSLLSRYDLLCCPSVCLEGGPTVAIEAHAVGTPVVGSRIGGLAEMIEDGTNGRLVAPGDWRALSRVLHEVWSDPSTVDRWRRALPPVRTMDQVAADYLRLYAGEV